MGVGILFDLVNFSGNTCCFHLVSEFHDLYFFDRSFYQNNLLMKRQNAKMQRKQQETKYGALYDT